MHLQRGWTNAVGLGMPVPWPSTHDAGPHFLPLFLFIQSPALADAHSGGFLLCSTWVSHGLFDSQKKDCLTSAGCIRGHPWQ